MRIDRQIEKLLVICVEDKGDCMKLNSTPMAQQVLDYCMMQDWKAVKTRAGTPGLHLDANKARHDNTLCRKPNYVASLISKHCFAWHFVHSGIFNPIC